MLLLVFLRRHQHKRLVISRKYFGEGDYRMPDESRTTAALSESVQSSKWDFELIKQDIERGVTDAARQYDKLPFAVHIVLHSNELLSLVVNYKERSAKHVFKLLYNAKAAIKSEATTSDKTANCGVIDFTVLSLKGKQVKNSCRIGIGFPRQTSNGICSYNELIRSIIEELELVLQKHRLLDANCYNGVSYSLFQSHTEIPIATCKI